MAELFWKLEIKCPLCEKMTVVRKRDVKATLHDDYYYFTCKKCQRNVTISVNVLPLDVIEDADKRFVHCNQ